VRRPLLLVLALALAGLAAGCGNSGGSASAGAETLASQTAEQTTEAPPGSIQALLEEKPGADVALVFGSSDFAIGDNRVTFLVVKPDGALLDAARANVYAAPGNLDSKPTLEATAENIQVGIADVASDGSDFDVSSVWVTHLSLDQPGVYSLLVEPDGTSLQAVGQIEVRDKTSVPEIGSKAPPSDTPTLEDGFPEDLTTATPPDTELLRYSVLQSIEDHVPFVVTFATPKYCQSRVCGPVVNVVDTVRRRLEGSGVRFIHVEIYQDNDPGQGFNRWVGEWNLPTEPYTFLVDGNGVVQAKFEGLVTVDELEQAVRDALL
jgi:hypothetical protein